MIEDLRLNQNKLQVPRRDDYEKRPVLSATIHPDIKRTLVAMSQRTGITVSQVTDEVLFTGLLEMQELHAPGKIPRGRTRLHPHLHKVVSRVFILILKIPSILTLC